MRSKWKVGFGAFLVLFVVALGFAAAIAKHREVLVLPLSFVCLTNVAGERSALFRFEVPTAPSFLNRQEWEMPKPEIALKLADGRRVTDPVLKPKDIQPFVAGTNAGMQMRISLPTNATAISMEYTIRLKEGFSAGSFELYLPIEKRILYRSGEVPVERDMR